VIDVYALQVFADSLNEQRRHDGGIYASGQRQQHFFVADLCADGIKLRCNE